VFDADMLSDQPITWIVTIRSRATDNILSTRIGLVLTGCSPGASTEVFDGFERTPSLGTAYEGSGCSRTKGVIGEQIRQTNISAT
jgi:hypothetical protein